MIIINNCISALVEVAKALIFKLIVALPSTT